MRFSEKSVLVTGAASGLGRAAAEAFLAEGAHVAINDLGTQEIAATIDGLGGDRMAAAGGDIATVAGCEAAIAATVAAFGGLDILVNNAGINIERPIEAWDEAMWDSHVNVILKGAFFCTRAGLAALRARRGCVVNVSSELGLHAIRNNVGYCAAKGGLVNMTRALALELAPLVRVNCVCPGAMDTALMRRCAEESGDVEAYYRMCADDAPAKRIASPDEVATSILYLASPDAAFVTGAALAVDGGGSAGR